MGFDNRLQFSPSVASAADMRRESTELELIRPVPHQCGSHGNTTPYLYPLLPGQKVKEGVAGTRLFLPADQCGPHYLAPKWRRVHHYLNGFPRRSSLQFLISAANYPDLIRPPAPCRGH
ncbi:hypothetical protein CDAR_35791 [Caerostris darwini]|uniref:Uncharacterized protein n=1 Tax=Caerostris darwini TaxID=1538125 RepID=A0AAV4VC66_9ARAC|nr:hypothetical protein CDAR_35791 [Caerostris darwini]